MKKDIETSIKALKECGKMIIDYAESIEKDLQQKKPERKLSIEEVRAVLAEKSREGFTKQIKELLNKHGVEKLSDVAPEEYETLLSEAEVLKNAD